MAQDDGIAVGRRGAKRTLAQPPDLGSHACGYRRCAAPRGGVMSALGRPGGAHAAPTLAAIAAALRAALMRPPRLRLSPLRCPPRGSNERLGAARRRSYDRAYLAGRRKARVPAVARRGGGTRVDHILECVELLEIVATAKRYRYALRDELSGT